MRRRLRTPVTHLRVLLLLPSAGNGGNATAAGSLTAALAPLGVATRILVTGDPRFPARLRETLRTFRPDVVHALHARKGGHAYLRCAPRRRPPLVISLTGTDMFVDPDDGTHRAQVEEGMRAAAVVLSDGRAMARAAAALVPDVAARIVVTPQGFEAPPRGRRTAGLAAMGLPATARVLFLPAGLRPVKDPLFPLDAVGTLRRRDPRIVLVHCGERLDEATADALARRAAADPGVRTLGEVPRSLMWDLYAAATLVLNTSRAEGLSNAVGEAQALGRAVLASDIPANRELVRHGVDGWLYRAGSLPSFLRATRRLLADGALRRRLGAAGRRIARTRDPSLEAAAVREAYLRAMGSPPNGGTTGAPGTLQGRPH